MLGALYANPNWDQKDAKREEHIKELNRHYNRAITLVYYPDDREDDVEIDWNHPFYAAAKRGLEKTRVMLGISAEDGDPKMGEVVDLEAARERDAARERGIKSIDQYGA